MLSVNQYPQEHVDDAREAIGLAVEAYDAMVAAGHDSPGHDRAIEAFEPVFFAALLRALDGYFTHRSRTIELQDGNPLNEVRVLVDSIAFHRGLVTIEKSTTWNPAATVLHYEMHDRIHLTRADFLRLEAAYLDAIEKKFV
jgi:hypothetical protein